MVGNCTHLLIERLSTIFALKYSWMIAVMLSAVTNDLWTSIYQVNPFLFCLISMNLYRFSFMNMHKTDNIINAHTHLPEWWIMQGADEYHFCTPVDQLCLYRTWSRTSLMNLPSPTFAIMFPSPSLPCFVLYMTNVFTTRLSTCSSVMSKFWSFPISKPEAVETKLKSTTISKHRYHQITLHPFVYIMFIYD